MLTWPRLLADYSSFTIATIKPDGDAVGSMIALGLYLQKLGKDTRLHSRDPLSKDFVQWVRHTGLPTVSQSEEVLCSSEVLVIVDADMQQFHFSPGALRDTITVNIDHHRSNLGGVQLLIWQPEYAATCEQLLELIPAKHLDSQVTTALLVGMITDTGWWQFPNATPAVVQKSLQLIERGADLGFIGRLLQKEAAIPASDWAKLWQNIRYDAQAGVVTAAILGDEDELLASASGNFLNALGQKARYMVLYKQIEPDLVKASLRTARDDVDVAAIAEHYGGGGHAKAAGYKVKGQLIDHGDKWVIE